MTSKPKIKYFNRDTWNDRWVAEEVFKQRRDGFFVELGAAGGVWGSSCYYLERELGWTGISVEARGSAAATHWEKRPNTRWIDACLSDREEEVDFIEFSKKGGFSGIDNEKTQRFLRNHKPPPESFVIKKKKTTTLERVLKDNDAPKVIDYLSVDIEGSELKTLSVFPFDEFIFKAISIEGGSCTGLLEENGYIKVKNPYIDKSIGWEHHFIHRNFIEIKYKV